MPTRNFPLYALLLISLSVPAFADDDDAPAADENQPKNSSINGVGAKTTYELPENAPNSTEDTVPALPPMRKSAGSGGGGQSSGGSLTRSQLATGGGGLSGGGGGVTCGQGGSGGVTQCVVTPKSRNHFEVSADLASMSQHMLAHGGMNFTPDNGYAVGFFPDSRPGINGVGNARVLDAPAFPNQGCLLAMWLSPTPGGAPYGGATYKAAEEAGCAGSAGPQGMLQFSSDPKQPGCHIPPGVRSYVNVQVNMPPFVANESPWFGNVPDRSGKFGWRQKICSGILNSPLGSLGPGGPSAAQAAQSAASSAAAEAAAAIDRAYREAHPCKVCLYNNGGGSCVSCSGMPVNCNTCPAGTPGPGTK